MASGNPRRPPDRRAESLGRAAKKVETATAELRRKADQLEALGERLANFDLWTRPEPGSRRPRFSRDEIAGAALRIADTEGFDALSMRRLAAELGAGTMTLYHYVRTKDELLSLVNDTVMGELLVPAGQLPDDWRAAITMIATRSRDALRRHPWSLDIRDDPGPGPNGVRHFDQSMQAVMSLDLTLGEKFELVTAVDEYVFGFCLAERSTAVDIDAMPEEMVAYVERLVATGEYPTLTALSEEYGTRGAFEVLRAQIADPDRFGRNLARLLDGFAAGLERR